MRRFCGTCRPSSRHRRCTFLGLAVAYQHCMGATVSRLLMLLREIPQSPSQLPVRVRYRRCVTQRETVLTNDLTHPSLRHARPILQHLHGAASPRRAHKFPQGISLSASIRRLLVREDLLQPLSVAGLQTAVLVPPPVIRLFGHPEVQGHRCNFGALTQHPVSLAQLPDDLVRRVRLRLAIVMLFHPHIVGNGLSPRTDRS